MSNQYKDQPGAQQYLFTNPIKFPDGSEITCYSTKDNRRLVIKHSSGSHIEFKNDGTLVVKAVKDLHINSSVNSSTSGGGNEDSSITNIKCESDLNLDVTGRLTISCKTFDLVAKDSGKVNTSGDFVTNANNVISKAKEQISLEGTKSTYISTGELREKVVTRTTEAGTLEPGGGQTTMNVRGHFTINNQDPKGGITLKSAGYMNILTAAERIDLTGNPGVMAPFFDATPFGLATYTHIVSPYPGPTPKGIPGSYYIQNGPGPYTQNTIGAEIKSVVGASMRSNVGIVKENFLGAKLKNVLGTDVANVLGAFIMNSPASIFLN